GVKLGAVWNDAQGVLFAVRVSEVQASEKATDAPLVGEGKVAPIPAADGTAADDRTDVAAAPSRPREMTVAAVDPEMTGQFTKGEVEVLERLAQRRAELERRAEELDMRDNLLKAAEARIDEKIAKLREMEETLKALLRAHDEEKKAQMESLVKIYEKMKPKDAARIFNNLDMDI